MQLGHMERVLGTKLEAFAGAAAKLFSTDPSHQLLRKNTCIPPPALHLSLEQALHFFSSLCSPSPKVTLHMDLSAPGI